MGTFGYGFTKVILFIFLGVHVSVCNVNAYRGKLPEPNHAYLELL